MLYSGRDVMEVISRLLVVLLLLQLLVIACASEDLYAVLGVPRDSNRRHIKNAYIKQAKKWYF